MGCDPDDCTDGYFQGAPCGQKPGQPNQRQGADPAVFAQLGFELLFSIAAGDGVNQFQVGELNRGAVLDFAQARSPDRVLRCAAPP